ncbi:MAG: hypothetical protein CL878_10730, partial [Dehalococcoidia bacterium]|nr:hypothetical protein [Dehalococcoidia bacterium]
MRATLAVKLYGGFGAIIFALIIVGVVAVVQLNRVSTNSEQFAINTLEAESQISNLHVNMLSMRRETLIYLAVPEEFRPLHLEEIRKFEPKIAGDVQALKGRTDLTDQQRTLLAATEQRISDWIDARNQGPVALTEAGDAHAGVDDALHGGAHDAFETAEGALGAFHHETRAVADAVGGDVQAASTRATQVTIGLVAIAVIAAAGTAFFLTRSITRGVRDVSQATTDLADRVLPDLAAVTAAVAAGDFTKTAAWDIDPVTVRTNDELGDMAGAFNTMIVQLESTGRGMNEMVGNLRGLIGQVAGTATSLAESSAQLSGASDEAGQATQGIATTIQQVASGADDQSERVQQTASAMQQLSQSIDQIAAGSQEQTSNVEQATEIVAQVSTAINDVALNAQAGADGTRQANEAAQSGAEMVRQTVDGMGRIKAAVDSVSTTVTQLGEQSAQIGNIVAVIDDIAAQTNLLALNA